jgi:hypothetical protein
MKGLAVANPPMSQLRPRRPFTSTVVGYLHVATVGFDAKILVEGELDISHEAIGLAEVVGIAEHGKELPFNQFRDSFRDILRHYPTRCPHVQNV